jgi:O-antigen/teichoic acid export membrane protein
MNLGVVRRLGWGMIDQVFSSGTNFALSIAAARALTAEGFGSFSVAFSLYILALGLSRSLTTEPLVVRWSAARPDELIAAARQATGGAVACGLVAGGVLLATGSLLGGDIGSTVVALAFVVPGLLLQDAWRYVFFAGGRPRAAAANDLVWGIAQFVVYGTLFALHSRSPELFVAGWGLSASVAALFGVVQARAVPSVGSGFRWIRRQGDLGFRFTVDFIASSGATQSVMLAVGAIVGVGAVGGLRAGAVLMGPLHILLIGSTSIVMPESVRDRQRSKERFLRRLRWLSFVLAGSALAWSAVLTALPASLGRSILGASWRTGHPLLPAFALVMAAAGALAGATVGLRALEAADRALRCRMKVLPLTLTFGIVGGFLGDGLGTALGLAAANGLGAVIYWRGLLSALNQPEERELNHLGETVAAMGPQAA